MRVAKVITVCLVLSICAALAPAQTPKIDERHYSKNGLSFDYPADVTVQDQSNTNGQHLVLTHSDHGAQIQIMSRYQKIESATKLAEARHEILDAFVDGMNEEFKREQAQVERTEPKIEVAGQQASGVRLRTTLAGEAGNAEAYSLLIGKRLVLITFIGSDKELAAGSSAWAMIRRSFKIADNAVAVLSIGSHAEIVY